MSAAAEGLTLSAEAATFVRTWRVGSRTCTLTTPNLRRGKAQCVVIEWAPTVPVMLALEEIAEYRAGRDAALADLQAQHGIPAAVVEL
jgi:hypothetical protein